ncbi:MAG: hypothetical protein EBV23_04160 [Flavobacteriia bacterium]|nr:hypothetical protein [Flavobacteriia bacterium]
MKSVSIVLCTMLVVVSCVSSKKFKALQEQQRICTEELAKFKESSEFFQSKSELLQAKLDTANKTIAALRLDTARLGNSKRSLTRELGNSMKELDELTKTFERYKSTGQKETSALQKQLEQKNGKIYVSMEAKLLFKSGSIVVESEGKKALQQIGKALENEKDLEIVVEGHTDTDKLNSASFPRNNWELSVLRATSVVEILLANSKMNPAKLIAAGRSEFQPVDPADKAKNRRIEIIISPNLDELFDIISKD